MKSVLHTLLVLRRRMCVACINSSVQICMVKYNRFVQVPSGRCDCCHTLTYYCCSLFYSTLYDLVLFVYVLE